MGDDHAREFHRASGVSFEIINTQVDRELTLNYEYTLDKVQFIFVLEGESEISVDWGGTQRTYRLNSGYFIPFNMHEATSVNRFSPGNVLKFMSITLDSAYLKSILGAHELDRLDKLISLNNSNELAPRTKVLLTGFFSNHRNGLARKLYFHGKFITVLSDLIEQLYIGKYNKKETGSAFLTPVDIKRIHRAKEILFSNIASPPSLLELSAMVSTNLNKLKVGFRHLYGKPPYKLLHDYRMEIANQLLSKREMNVSEVAWAVGYTSLGHFSLAFHKYFGVKPKAFQLDMARPSQSKATASCNAS